MISGELLSVIRLLQNSLPFLVSSFEFTAKQHNQNVFELLDQGWMLDHSPNNFNHLNSFVRPAPEQSYIQSENMNNSTRFGLGEMNYDPIATSLVSDKLLQPFAYLDRREMCS